MICANILLFFNIYLYKLKRKRKADPVIIYVEAMALWMLLSFMMLEVLSLFDGVSRGSLLVCWCVTDILLGLLLVCQNKRAAGIWQKQFVVVKKYRGYAGGWFLVVIGLWVIVLACNTVPYNWDSMTYRLSRVAHWAQNGSVGHYASNCVRALANPPLGEFVQLHVYLLSGKTDYFFNLLQAFSYITCAVLVYALAKRLGCTKVFCFLATLLFMTMPIAFSEAVNTQVDLFATVWLLGFVYLLLDFKESVQGIGWSGENGFATCTMGLCVAWGYLSKPSVCIAMVLFLLWLLIHCVVRRDKFVVLLRLALCAFGGMFVPMMWEIGRNLHTYHAVSAPIAGARQLVGTFAPNYVLVNFLKNVTYNMPCELWQKGSDYMASLLLQLSEALNVPINAEEIAEDGRQFFYWKAPNYAHDTAINPIIVWLMIICIIWSLIRFRRINYKKLYHSYSMTAILCFLVFCAVLRWEPYVTRYMLSFLTLLCPAIALMVQKQVCNQKKRMQMNQLGYFIVAVVFIFCVKDLIGMSEYHWHMRRDTVAGERPHGYFANRSTEYDTVMSIVQLIKDNGYGEIGLRLGEDDYEYPYWALLEGEVGRIEHVRVKNESAVYLDEEYQPDCIVWYGKLPEKEFKWNGQTYSRVRELAEKRYVLMLPE